MALFGKRASKEVAEEHAFQMRALSQQLEVAEGAALEMKQKTDEFDKWPLALAISQYGAATGAIATLVFFALDGVPAFFGVSSIVGLLAWVGSRIWATSFRQKIRWARHRPLLAMGLCLPVFIASIFMMSQTRLTEYYDDWSDDYLPYYARNNPELAAVCEIIASENISSSKQLNESWDQLKVKYGQNLGVLRGEPLRLLLTERDGNNHLRLYSMKMPPKIVGAPWVLCSFAIWCLAIQIFFRPLYLSSEIEQTRRAKEAQAAATSIAKAKSKFESKYVTAGSWLKLGAAITVAVVAKEVASGLLDGACGDISGGESSGGDQVVSSIGGLESGGELVDINGDGVMDETAWGTAVEKIDPYRRSGSLVRGHYRTIADGLLWNNLR